MCFNFKQFQQLTSGVKSNVFSPVGFVERFHGYGGLGQIILVGEGCLARVSPNSLRQKVQYNTLMINSSNKNFKCIIDSSTENPKFENFNAKFENFNAKFENINSKFDTVKAEF